MTRKVQDFQLNTKNASKLVKEGGTKFLKLILGVFLLFSCLKLRKIKHRISFRCKITSHLTKFVLMGN